MNRIEQHKTLIALLTIIMALLCGSSVLAAENVDPDNDGSQYAWGENVEWLNAEPLGNGGPGVEVEDSKLTGHIWAENIGWISLSCENTSSCGTVDYGVTKDGLGNLSGYAWAENAGWISFSCDNTGTCGTVDYGVIINAATGDFSGYGWGENIGWISFSCENMGSCGTVNYRVTTSWPASPGQPSTVVPTMTGWGMIVLSVLTAGSALWFIRRRKWRPG